jgi:hypothetical protein
VKWRWNWLLWLGFLFVVAALFSYPFFVLFPVTRDFPWANLALFCAGGVLLGAGIKRAFRQPERYRGKILGPILAVLSVLVFALFAYGIFYEVRQLPSATGAPAVGQKAPDFTLPDQNGKSVALADVLLSPAAGQANPTAKGLLLIFYRGYW